MCAIPFVDVIVVFLASLEQVITTEGCSHDERRIDIRCNVDGFIFTVVLQRPTVGSFGVEQTSGVLLHERVARHRVQINLPLEVEFDRCPFKGVPDHVCLSLKRGFSFFAYCTRFCQSLSIVWVIAQDEYFPVDTHSQFGHPLLEVDEFERMLKIPENCPGTAEVFHSETCFAFPYARGIRFIACGNPRSVVADWPQSFLTALQHFRPESVDGGDMRVAQAIELLNHRWSRTFEHHSLQAVRRLEMEDDGFDVPLASDRLFSFPRLFTNIQMQPLPVAEGMLLADVDESFLRAPDTFDLHKSRRSRNAVIFEFSPDGFKRIIAFWTSLICQQ